MMVPAAFALQQQQSIGLPPSDITLIAQVGDITEVQEKADKMARDLASN